MNDKFILDRINQGKITMLKTNEIYYILNNDFLKEKFIEKIESGEVSDEEYTNEFVGIIEKYPDIVEKIYDGHLRLLEKSNKKELFNQIKGPNGEGYSKKAINEYRNKYLEEVKQAILNDPYYFYDKYSMIDWPEIIDFIIDNNIETLLNIIDINLLDLSKESSKEVIKKRIDFLSNNNKTIIVDNIDVLEYLNNNSLLINNIILSFSREDYSEKEIKKIIDLLQKLPCYPDIIKSRQLNNYIVDNEIEVLYNCMNPNYLTLDRLIKVNQVAVDLVNNGERDYFNINPRINIKFSGIMNFELIKQILDNKVEFYYGLIFTEDLNLEQYLEIKEQLIENHQMIKPNLSIDKNIIKEIIKTRTKELYPYTIKSWGMIDGFNSYPIEKEDVEDFIYYLDILVKQSNMDAIRYLKDDEYKLNNKYVLEYILFNKEEWVEFIDINALDINKNNIFKLIELKRKGLIDHPIINLLSDKNDSEINKFIELFKNRLLNERQISIIQDAYQQAIFRDNNYEIKNIFSNIKNVALDTKISIEEKEEYIEILVKDFIDCVPKFYEQILLSNNADMPILDKKELFIREILHRVLIDNEFGTNLDILHEITDIYVAKKANEYSSRNGIDRIAGLYYDYDIKDNEKIINKDLFNYLKKNYYNVLLDIIKNNGYTKNSIEGFDIREAKRIFIDWFNTKVKETTSILPRELQFLFKDEVFIKSLKRKVLYQRNNTTLGTLLNEATIQEYELLFKNVINNNSIYKKLVEIIDKYKILEWSSVFDDSIALLSGNEITNFISFLINYDTIFRYRNREYLAKKYDEILNIRYKECVKTNGKISKNDFEKLYGEDIRKQIVEKEFGEYTFSIVDILRDTMAFDKHNNIYKYILGADEFRLIKSNPGPNEASMSSNLTKGEFIEKRLNRAIEMSLKMIDKNEITIPSFRVVLNLSNGKRIMVTVGNKTSTKNLVLGERTGACMRIYGIGNGLLDFCCLDPRGLHIIFEEPDTDRFISRISGYRQGNTLLLNQLRKSESINYSNSDLVEALKKISSMIIDKSFESEKEEEIPIENVIASPDFALQTEKTTIPTFKKEDVALPMYSDVGNGPIVVLATRGEELTPVKINKNNQHIYLPVRTVPKVYIGYSEEMEYKYKRIKVLEEYRKHAEDLEIYKGLEDDGVREDLEALIVSDDWAVILTKDLKIEMINASTDNRSYKEIEEALVQIKNIKNRIMMEKEVGYDTGEFKAKR